jgi:hypothetical protein
VQKVRDLCHTFSVQQLWVPMRMKGTPEITELGQSGIRVVYANKASWLAGVGLVTVKLDY